MQPSRLVLPIATVMAVVLLAVSVWLATLDGPSAVQADAEPWPQVVEVVSPAAASAGASTTATETPPAPEATATPAVPKPPPAKPLPPTPVKTTSAPANPRPAPTTQQPPPPPQPSVYVTAQATSTSCQGGSWRLSISGSIHGAAGYEGYFFASQPDVVFDFTSISRSGTSYRGTVTLPAGNAVWHLSVYTTPGGSPISSPDISTSSPC